MKTRFLLYLFIPLFLTISSCVRNPVTGKRDFMLISKKQEIAMGQQADPEIVSFFGLYEDPKLQRFIEEKGQKMAAISHRSELEYDFKIVDSPVINAFAVPGGYVYFTRGIMAHFNNEAEFAGVLGHEIGHIAARHSAKQQSKAVLAQVGLIAGMVISPEFAQFADVASQGVGLLFLKFGRDAERESDRLGVEYAAKIGYDSEEMAEFYLTLHRIAGETAGATPSFLSTHPDPEDRYEAVKELAAVWKKKLPENEFEVNRNEYLRMIDGMIYGPDPKQGFVENQVFYHPVLKFRFPLPKGGWTFQNTPQQVQMAHESGKAILLMQLAQGTSLEAAARAVLEKNQLQLVETEQVNVNGLPALAMVADQKQEQQTLRTLSYFISYGGVIYHFFGITTLNEFNTFYPIFTSTMTNFQELTEPDKLNRQPERIQVKTVASATSLAQALRINGVPEDRLEELAILNGMALDTRVTAGMLIKVLER